MPLVRSTSSLALAALLAAWVPAVQDAGPPPGLDRERMWYAPGAEDWKRPCLIVWQRTWEDAVAVAQETNRPLLVCVNMDGEIASEHYAGVRYRQPEIAALYEPYVCVIASVYRHSPRDHDEEGNRVPCPRFGTVTCGEHIAIEPVLYEKFFDGRRIAPRHICVELDGQESYDVYYAWDTDSVFQAVREGMQDRQDLRPMVRGDRPILERVASREVRDRMAVEEAYREGDAAQRAALVEAAAKHLEQDPVELLRLAVSGLDMGLAAEARGALARTDSPAATDVITEALAVPLDPQERDGLIGALARIGEKSPRARTLAVVHRGLATRSRAVDVESWSRDGLVEAPEGAAESYAREARLREQDRVLESSDPEAHVELAEAFLERALDHKFDPEATSDTYARLLFLDARSTAEKAEALAADWRDQAVLALANYYLGDSEAAAVHAAAAVEGLPEGDGSWNSMAVLELFAKLRCQAIAKAVEEKKDWPPEWLTDVNAACAVLARHPFGTAAQVAWHFDILQWLGASGQADRALDEGLARFPGDADLHERLRRRVLREQGVEGLEAVYEKLLARADAPPEMEWYAGHASVVTAEFQRRRGDAELAPAAYERAVAHYRRSAAASPELAASAAQGIALAFAGKARVLLQHGDAEAALESLLECFEADPGAAATPDGLNLSPADTVRTLRAALVEAQREDLLATLDAAVAQLDPALLGLPDYERDVPAEGRRPRADGADS